MALLLEIVLFCIIVLVVLIIRCLYIVFSLPVNNSKYYDKIKSKKVCVCIGDSLTHGNVSGNYVEKLMKKNSSIDFINAGVNGNTIQDVIHRLSELINLKPDYITILIGTNDVRQEDFTCSSSFKNLFEIISILKTYCASSTISICSVPPAGEDLQSKLNSYITVYNNTIRMIAKVHNISYIPVYESFLQVLCNSKQKSEVNGEFTKTLCAMCIIQHYLLFQSWNSLSHRFGYHLSLPDHLHINDSGADIICNLISKWLENTSDGSFIISKDEPLVKPILSNTDITKLNDEKDDKENDIKVEEQN